MARRYDHHYPYGLQPFDFDADHSDERVGRVRPSAVDRMLAAHEEEPSVLPRPGPLCHPDEWLEALQLPAASRMRRNPRFVRVLEEYSHPSKYSAAQKRQMLHALKFGLACDPERAGFEGGVLPYEVPGFAPHEMSERYTGAIAADPAKKKKAAK